MSDTLNAVADGATHVANAVSTAKAVTHVVKDAVGTANAAKVAQAAQAAMLENYHTAGKLIGGGAAAAGVGGAGAGIGAVFGHYISAVARNPSAASKVQTYLWLGFALSEATALYALLIAFLVLFAF